MRGVFWGIEDTHKQGDFVRAILDGLCYELKNQIDGYSRMFGEAFGEVRVVGGLSKSERIMGQKARIQQGRIEVPSCTEAACLGAALLGAIGAGRISFPDLGKLYQKGREYRGYPSEQETRRYETYLKIRQRIKELYGSLGEA